MLRRRTTREYQIGDFGHRNVGPDPAIFYDDIYEQTIVEVIQLGHADSGAETLRNESGTICLELADVLYISEDKTGKVRPVYINKAVRTAIELVIKKKNLSENNYVFRTDGNKRAYLFDFKRNANGDIEDAITTFERFDENGNEREVAPFSMSAVIRWLKKTSKELGIYGHYSSHAMRKTFIEHISRNFEDNRNPLVASIAVAHSSVKTTVEYYMSVDPIRLREKWLGLNLGLEALKTFCC